MGVNQGIAGLPKGTDVIYRNRADALNAGNHNHLVAGAPIGTEVITERAAAPMGNVDEIFKAELAKVYDNPQGLNKSETVEVVETEPSSALDLIRKAQSAPLDIFDLDRGYSGREQAALAKSAEAKPREVTASDLDHVSPTLRKALGDFDQIVRRALTRPSAARF